jgi:heparin binding hemagglutinin HbhA
MTAQTQPKIPNPIYAAAGAGDLAMERLRKLPEKVAVLQGRVNKAQDELPARINGLGDKVTQKVAEFPAIVAELRQRVVDADADKLRESARRNAGAFVANAQAAQDRAAALYAALVARGERVVTGDGSAPAGPVHADVVPTDGKTKVVPTAKTNPTKPAKRAPKAPKAS